MINSPPRRFPHRFVGRVLSNGLDLATNKSARIFEPPSTPICALQYSAIVRASRKTIVCGRNLMREKKFNALPGFNLTMGITVFFLTVIVLIPLAGLVLRSCEISWREFVKLVTDERALAAFQLTFGASLFAAVANVVLGTILAWVLVRYEFPGRRFIDAIVDFPFALPTAVAGLTLANLFAANGWLGRYLVPLGFEGAFTPLGVVIALTFV